MDRYTKDILEALDLRLITVTHTDTAGIRCETIIGPSKRIYAQFAQILMPSTGNRLASKGHAISADGTTSWYLKGANLDEPLSQFHASNVRLYTLTDEAYYGAVMTLTVTKPIILGI